MGALFIVLLQALVLVRADIYLHNPRGSNNRLDERGRARENANRLFDSQNNNRGGYNVGSVYYYAGSVVPIEWTNQHSCSDPKNHCELIIQYMCGPRVRDGTTTKTIPENKDDCRNKDCNNDLRYGMHEDYNYYMNCKYRQRNKGLFTADQNLKGKTAKYTRQNPGGTRRGYECPEERDYYPYWSSSPWRDIVVLTGDTSRCEYYQKESQNVKDRYGCVVPPLYFDYAKNKRIPIPDEREACEKVRWPLNDPDGAKGKWTKFASHGIDAPECLQAPWSRDNHLGNGWGGYPNMYNWTLPNIQDENCVLRLRYNISTNDYDGWNTNSSSNGNPATGIDIGKRAKLSSAEAVKRGFVFKQNPVVQPLGGALSNKLQLRLAINTAQYGRTFQDRSHTFAIRKPPETLQGKRIINVNVRGKRGNIVQVYPSVEYDFVPNALTISKGDYIHFQWTGSNTNNEGNDGQGLRGTDRNNVVLLAAQRYPEGTPGAANPTGKFGHWGNNYPEHVDKVTFLGLSKDDLRRLAYLQPGQFRGELSELDDAGTYFDLAPRKVTAVGTFHYMCTRNNNFSNRSQKGKIIVLATSAVAKLLGWSGGQVVLQDGVQGIWIKKDTLLGSKSIRVEEWPTKDGEKRIESTGGKINAGDAYASNFLSIEPTEQLTQDGKSVTVKLKINSDAVSKAKVYFSSDGRSWKEVKDVDFSKGIATFQAQRGGIYVAREHKNYWLIAGICIALAFLLVLVIGTVIMCRKKPDLWANCKGKARNVKRSFQGQV